MRPVLLGGARVGQRLDDLVFSRKKSGAAFVLGTHRTKRSKPASAQIASRLPGFEDVVPGTDRRHVGGPNARRNSRLWHDKSPQRTGLRKNFKGWEDNQSPARWFHRCAVGLRLQCESNLSNALVIGQPSHPKPVARLSKLRPPTYGLSDVLASA